MIRRALSSFLLLALVLCAGSAVIAQTGSVPDQGARESAAAALKRLDAAYQEARSAYYAALSKQRAERKEDPEAKLARLVNPDPEYVTAFRAAAKHHAGSAESTALLIRAFGICYRTDEVAAKELLDELLDGHMQSDQLPGISSKLRIGAFYLGHDTVRAAITRIIDESPHDKVKAAFLYARSDLVVRFRTSTPEERAAAVQDLDRAIELGASSHIVASAEAAKFELENLQVGLPAPEIEGEDLDGVAFKLSDYRGKVVVLDFWGDW